MIAQIETVATEGGKLLSGRSDVMVAAVLMLAFAAFILWQNHRDRSESRRMATERDEADQVRRDKRDAETARRHDEQNQFNRDMAMRNANQLEVMTSALDRTSKSNQMMAETSKTTAQTLAHLARAQRRDRAAIVSVIDAEDARTDGQTARSRESLQQARKHLMSD